MNDELPQLYKIAERAAQPDLTATEKIEICASIAVHFQGEPVIRVLQQLDAERQRREKLEVEVNMSRLAKCPVEGFVEIVGQHFLEERFRVAITDETKYTSILSNYDPTPRNQTEIYYFMRINENIFKRIG